MLIHLTTYNFDDWVNFIFNHPVPEKSEKEWYWEEEWEGEPVRMLQQCIQLFSNSTFLIERFSPEQIDQGFWFLLFPSSNWEGWIHDWIWDKAIDWSVREACILSMVHVFEHLFSINPMGSTCFMWWDILRNMEEDPDHQVQGAMLQGLERILRLDSLDCRMAALHGLGHLTLPDRVPVIENFLSAHPELDAETRAYAFSAMTGRIL